MAARTIPAETTPKARLASIIKTARDIMRKDAGLNGDRQAIGLVCAHD
ncbi:MAG: hypothetical protein ACRDS9_01250 [Pseudonocardiaceae bacterium]